jgi:hypothetical protein
VELIHLLDNLLNLQELEPLTRAAEEEAAVLTLIQPMLEDLTELMAAQEL